jgi:TonB family protein
MQAAVGVNKPSQFGEQWVGQVVDGRYPLQKCLGSSENSALFATEIGGEQGARAVIKLALASSCDAEGQLALWRRAAKLSHTNLLRILDGGRCWLNSHELIFLVSEYAEENLGEVLTQRTLNASECNSLLRPMIGVLKYVHQQGLVHGRLRPSNVMAVNDQLKISSDCIRPAGEMKDAAGASAYDAPELKSGKISSAADVWSLGAILAECLPAMSAGQNGSQKILPQPFAEIVRHCLRTEPSSRWTLAQIEAHLAAEAAGQSLEPRQSDAGESMRRYLPLAMAVVLIVIVAAIYGVMRGGNKSAPTPAPKTAAAPNAASGTSAPARVVPAVSPAVKAADSTGAVLRRVSPAAAPSSLRTVRGRLKVRVRVDVDTAGNVTGEKLVTAGPSKYFSRLAMQAAQQWKFTPPTQNGQAAPSQWTILFEYTRGGISEQAEMR